jgi:exodeoxyribonuclease X
MERTEITWLVVDTETTGVDPNKDAICQIAGVWIQGDKVLHRFESLVNPGRHIPPEASAVHHLTDKHVKDAPQLRDVLVDMLHNSPEFDALAAHNAEFDFGFLAHHLELKKPILCTMRLARKLWDAPHYSNQYLRYALKLDVPEVEGLPAHSALPDALVTAKLLMVELVESQGYKRGATVEVLVQWANEPNLLEFVAFGKHKGIRWSEVPRDYLHWALN